MEKFRNTTPAPSEEMQAIAEARHAEEQAVAAELQARSERITELRNAAPVEAKRLLSELVPELSPEESAELPDRARVERIEQKIAALTTLLAEYSQTKEGSTAALNNDHRYLVEALAEMLENEKANRELIDGLNEISAGYDAVELKRYIKEITERKDAA